MKHAIVLFFVICFFSCAKKTNKLDYKSLSSYNIVTDIQNKDIADTLNVYLKKSLGIQLEIENSTKKNNVISLMSNPSLENNLISFNFSNSAS